MIGRVLPPCARLRAARRAVLVLSLLAGPALAGLAGPGPPQDPEDPEEQIAAAEQLRWFPMQDQLTFSELLQAASFELQRPIEFERDQVPGQVRLSSDAGYTGEELWDFINLELARRGKATVQTPGTRSLRVVDAAQAAQMARIEEPDLEGAVAGYLRVLVPLSHVTSGELVPTLQQLVTKDVGKIQPVAERGALLLADHRPQLEQMLRVVRVIDTPAAPPRMIEVKPRHASPLALKGLVEQVNAARTRVVGTALKGAALNPPGTRTVLVVAPEAELEWWRSTIEHFDRPEEVETVRYQPRRFRLGETARLIEQVVRGEAVGEAPGTWRVVEDQLTGTLFITTTPSKHREIRDLILDVEGVAQGPRRVMRSFEIRHRQVKEVLALLQELLESGALEEPAATAAATAPPASEGQEVVEGPTAPIDTEPDSAFVATLPDENSKVILASDEATNRIIAFGEGRILEQVALLIQTLDVRHRQVLIEAVVVTLSESQTRDLGVELQHQGTSGDVLYRLSSLFGLGSPDPAAGALPPPSGAGFSGVVLSPGDFSAIVRALETVNEGRSLQVPKVLVNNNKEAQLDSVLEQPFVSVNASTTVATTSFGGVLQAGTAIMVKPQLAEGDQIVLDYTVSLSSFVGESADPALPPPRLENKLSSVVTIPDGFTVVVGGLEIETESKGMSRLPWLGSLPIAGVLFQSRSQKESRSRFFVFLRASVMRSASFEDLRYLSARDAETAGVEDSWPKLQPRWIH